MWKYNVDVAVAAARAGFDEIMFDYVRFPSDGDVDGAVYRQTAAVAKREAVPAFLAVRGERLEPYGVRVSAAVFGLSATRDLGIGQLPRKMAPYIDTVYAMTYPSLFGAGRARASGSERGSRRDRLACPPAVPARAARSRGLVVPWVQDFSFSVPYGIERFERRSTQPGYRVRRATCSGTQRALYTDGALAPHLAQGARRSQRQPSPAHVPQAIVESVVAMRPELESASGTRR